MSDPYDITIPGTLPDLVQLTSPVYVVSGMWRGHKGVVVAVGDEASGKPGHVLVPFVHQSLRCIGVDWLPLDAVALDLTHTTGRHHARSWLSSRWPANTPQDLPPPFAYYMDARLAGLGGLPPVVPATPEFADFDPMDTRQLPDGSSRAAADGLRRICLCAHTYVGQVLHD